MRVVVIGAGVGGLAAAARLAASGHRVTICEAAGTVGGKLGWFERDGVGFDTGPSLLTMPWVFDDLFAATGGWPEGLELQPCEPLIRHRFADGSGFDSQATLHDTCAAMETWSPGAGEDWAALMARAARIWEASRSPFLESPLEGTRSLLSLALRQPRDLAALAPFGTLADLGGKHLRDPRLQMVLGRYATYAGSDPRRVPAALAAIPWVEQAYGGWWVSGGLHRLGEALHQRCLDLGVTVLTEARATRVQQPVTSVTLADGTRLPTDLVVSDVDATHLYRDLLHSPQAARRLARATPSLSGFVLLLALDQAYDLGGRHTVLFPADYDAELDAVFGGRIPSDPTLYVHQPASDQMFVLVNAPAGTTYPSSYDDGVLELLAARGVTPGIRWSESRSPADLERLTGSVGGAIYGSSSHGARAAFLRPANRSPVPGVFLVGGSAHPGGGLPLVALSARIVAELIGPA